MHGPSSWRCLEIRITGRVQGVGYRAFVQKTAVGLGLAGWVRNLPDGSVEAFAQGPIDRMESFLLALRRGPPGARVDAVQTAEAHPRDEPPLFRITY